MAKLASTFGALSGRVGGNVFYKGEDGKVIVRAYQPQVSNPKSVAQTDQRMKVNLAGRISAVTPKQVIIGMADSNRKRRSEFLKVLVSNITINRNVLRNEVSAQIAPDAIVFSRGSESLRATVAEMTLGAQSVSTSITLNDSTYAGIYGERLILACIDPKQQGGYSYLLYKDVLLRDTTDQTVTINLPTEPIDETMFCLYRIPFVLNEQGVSATKSDLYTNGTMILANIVENASNIRDYGNSTLAHTEVFTNA